MALNIILRPPLGRLRWRGHGGEEIRTVYGSNPEALTQDLLSCWEMSKEVDTLVLEFLPTTSYNNNDDDDDLKTSLDWTLLMETLAVIPCLELQITNCLSFPLPILHAYLRATQQRNRNVSIHLNVQNFFVSRAMQSRAAVAPILSVPSFLSNTPKEDNAYLDGGGELSIHVHGNDFEDWEVLASWLEKSCFSHSDSCVQRLFFKWDAADNNNNNNNDNDATNNNIQEQQNDIIKEQQQQRFFQQLCSLRTKQCFSVYTPGLPSRLVLEAIQAISTNFVPSVLFWLKCQDVHIFSPRGATDLKITVHNETNWIDLTKWWQILYSSRIIDQPGVAHPPPQKNDKNHTLESLTLEYEALEQTTHPTVMEECRRSCFQTLFSLVHVKHLIHCDKSPSWLVSHTVVTLLETKDCALETLRVESQDHDWLLDEDDPHHYNVLQALETNTSLQTLKVYVFNTTRAKNTVVAQQMQTLLETNVSISCLKLYWNTYWRGLTACERIPLTPKTHMYLVLNKMGQRQKLESSCFDSVSTRELMTTLQSCQELKLRSLYNDDKNHVDPKDEDDIQGSSFKSCELQLSCIYYLLRQKLDSYIPLLRTATRNHLDPGVPITTGTRTKKRKRMGAAGQCG